jgi:hypothetical protein
VISRSQRSLGLSPVPPIICSNALFSLSAKMRRLGLEPRSRPWQSRVLPLNYRRIRVSSRTADRSGGKHFSTIRLLTSSTAAKLIDNEFFRLSPESRKEKVDRGRRAQVRHVLRSTLYFLHLYRSIFADDENVDSWIRTRIDAVLQTAALPLELSPREIDRRQRESDPRPSG